MVIHNKAVVVYDIEVFPNCFHCCCRNTETDELHKFEISKRRNQLTELVGFFYYEQDKMFCGYNNKHYDDVIINYIIDKFNTSPGNMDIYILREMISNMCGVFTQEELDNRTDHYFIGDVDEYGQFSGRCRIFDKEYPNLKIVWRNVKGKKTECGPFKVVFAALQGSKSESMIAKRNVDAYREMYDKLASIGGMYVFRDGIKILPYGNNDFDWLEIEKRRNLVYRRYI